MENKQSVQEPRKFSLGLYLLLVFGLSWPFQLAGALWATDLLSLYLFNSAAMVMVAVGTFIAGRYVFRDGFSKAGWHWGKPKHYLWILGLVFMLWVFPTLVRLIIGSLELSSINKTQIIWLFILPLVTLIPGFGEEFGWRGYMLPRLAQRMGTRKAVALHALIWWAWHLPVLVGTGFQAGMASAAATDMPVVSSVAGSIAAVVLIGAIPGIMHGVVFAYIWTRSGSLPAATVYHAAYDGVRDSLSMIAGLPSMVGTWASVLLTVLGAFFLWKGNWKKLERESNSAENQP